ncbi:MAG: hypothetical protein NHB14_05825 [Desulfosporosinus sp.]|nr:hypothetical protein [Desulfosporosinus sp.]
MDNEFSQEILNWEEELLKKKIPRLFKMQKDYKDPRMEKIKEYRNRNRGYQYHFDSESKTIRKMTNRKFRRYAKTQLLEEQYKLIPHDYKTYGWLTW